MANKKTSDFLPSIFRTETNEKFLNATLDQLISDANFVRLDGYIGRKFAPTYKPNDGYLLETNKDRRNYQLEPSVVVSESNNIKFYSSYVDLLNKLEYYGAKVNNHDRLFSSEYYSFSGLIDLDKFVNFSQYYWLPNGPDPILIGTTVVKSHQTFIISKDAINDSYQFDNTETKNPEITLMRGGVYKFKVSQPGSGFWIQTQPGISGTKNISPLISTRDVFGVTNNGEDVGEVEFFVPLSTSQDFYLKMPMSSVVDFALDTTFAYVDGSKLSDINAYIPNTISFDGITLDTDGKTFVFISDSDSDQDWFSKNTGGAIDPEFRRGVWRVVVDRSDSQNPINTLQYVSNIAVDSRIHVRTGIKNAHKEFFKTKEGYLKPVPSLTAQLDELYYQDSSNPDAFGKIRLVDRVIEAVDVETDILGKKQWSNSSGIILSNGMKIQFGKHITPTKYINNTYIVEGVGSDEGIVLVDHSLMVCPELNIDESLMGLDAVNFDVDNIDEPYYGPIDPEYVVSNRSSMDLNAWSRQNCWYHISIIEASAEYNGTRISINQSSRARRPIIEFRPNIQMFNSGSIGMRPVDQIDLKYQDAFNQIQHSKTLSLPDLSLKNGQRVLFANDLDPLVRSQVYTVEYGVQDESVEREYYDYIGTGLLRNEPVYINFRAKSKPIPVGRNYNIFKPNLNIDYEYDWRVIGRDDLLGATLIEGLDLGSGSPDGVITSVKYDGNKNYTIRFKATMPISKFLIDNVKIRIASGLSEIIGYETKFQSEISIGSKIYDTNDVCIGTVATIHSDTSMYLERSTDYLLVNVEYKIKNPRVRLIVSPDPADIAVAGSAVVAKAGINKGVTFYFNGTLWIEAQIKTKKNQQPKFDVFNSDGISLSSTAVYPASSFSGTKVFSYKIGSGGIDAVLGFPLHYTTSSYTSSEITFENNFDNDSFEYLDNNKPKKELISLGYLRKNITATTHTNVSVWNLVSEKTRQYQIISASYSGTSNNFIIDILPEPSMLLPNIKVFLNNSLLSEANFKIVKINEINTIEIDNTILTLGDKIDILIYSKSVSNLGYYQIPSNLEYNSENASILDLNFGQLRNHFSIIQQNSKFENIRDLDVSKLGGNILQHASPIIYSSLFLISKQANFINALEFARQEYVKFKNKFLDLILTLIQQNQNNITIDSLLEIINQNKNNSFPWFYSDMVPYGRHKLFSYKITNKIEKQYRIGSKFDPSKLQSRAILVYYNQNLLSYGKDYVFSKVLPTIIIDENVDLSVNGILEIKEYDTDGNFIPETPTKLGLYPKFLPEIFIDSTYQKPTAVIQGHDGSLTPAFGDIRDKLLLELETRIFNNIKRNDDVKFVDINEYIPGQFRNTDYSLKEFNEILSSSFLTWVGDNRLDFSTNSYIINSDLFSYNYKNSKNKLSIESLPGWWRGIYKFLYDTDRPNTHPWEMLGFSKKPDWWHQIYGPAPYTSDNKNLWLDLENGIIRQGERKGIDKNYIRQGLSAIIPVDDQGVLLPPISIIISKFNSNRISDSFSFGDHGPVETAWRKSSEYPFAIQRALALMKPAFYFGTLFDINGYFKNQKTEEYVNRQNNLRVTTDSIRLNGEPIGSTISRASGYLNFILAYIVNSAADPFKNLRNLLDNSSVQLSYKMSGFSDKTYLTVLAEQYSPTSTNESIIIPSENYKVYLNKGSPISRATYSAVIIEKTQNGYSVNGYNTNVPYFIIIPSDVSANDSYTITVENTSAVIFNAYKKEKILISYGQEFTNKQQVVDFLISYQRYLMSMGFVFDTFNPDLKEQQNWVLSAKEFLTWTLQSWQLKSILVLSPVGKKLTLLLTNSVVDDLSDKNNQMTILDSNFNVIKIETLSVNRDVGVFSIESVVGETFALVDLNLIQFEHVLVFDNTTIFNDVIYKPELGSRQFRLKLVGRKSGGWDGTISSPGFIFNNSLPDLWKVGKDYLKGDMVSFKNKYYVSTRKISASDTFDINYWTEIPKSSIRTGLLPNFSQNASKFIDFYDVDSEFIDPQFRKLSSGLIGYRYRNYLSDLNIDLTTQTKFYQGYIKDKGTKKSISSLLSASSSGAHNRTASITFDEEWAIKVGEYGAQNSNLTLDIDLGDSDSITNSFGIIIDENSDHLGFIPVQSNKEYLMGSKAFPGFLTRNNETIRESDIPTAGYVNLDDVDFTLFDIANSAVDATNIQSMTIGKHIWVANDLSFNWQVYRIDESNNNIKSVEYGLDMLAIVTTTKTNSLIANDPIIIKQLHPQFDGLYIVEESINLNKFSIRIDQNQVSLLKQGSLKNIGQLFLLKSARYQNIPSVIADAQQNSWLTRNKFWVDSDENNRWAFYKKTENWKLSRKISLETSDDMEFVGYGSSISSSPDQKFIAAGSPEKNNGRGRIHVIYFNDGNYTVDTIDSQNPGMKSLGFCLDMSNEYLISGAPKFKNETGLVTVCSWDTNLNTYAIVQIICPPKNENTSLFGYSVSLTADSKTLYIGSPGNGAVYKYSLMSPKKRVQYIEFNPLIRTYKLISSAFKDPQVSGYLAVDINGEFLIPGLDYLNNFDNILLSDQKFLEYKNKLSGVNTVTIRVRLLPHYKYSGIKLVGGLSGSKFGHSIKISSESDVLLVGAPFDGLPSSAPIGSAYVFESDKLLQKIFPIRKLNTRSDFGFSVECSKEADKLYISAPNIIQSESSGGAVFCYAKKGKVYEIEQTLVSPVNQNNQEFGHRVKISPNDKSLLISSLLGSAKLFETYDQNSTIFDSNNTKFYQGNPGTGCVYLYEMLGTGPQSFIHTKEFLDGNSKRGDGFGNSIEITENRILIGSNFGVGKSNQIGEIYEYFNANNSNTWGKLRSQETSIDITSINNISLFNKTNGNILSLLDIVDPIKGKVLGIVDQDLDYRSSTDPAVYNSGSLYSNGIILDHSWASSQLGKTWWDLSKVRYIDYEQSELTYRLKTWGQIFPGSEIHVYEWSESDTPPSKHISSNKPGIPLNGDDSRYSSVSYTNTQSGNIVVKYYYWVRLLTKIPNNSNRSISIAEMEQSILNPNSQSIPYVGFLSKNSMAIFNSRNYISGSDIVLRVNYDKVLNSNLNHNEYALVGDGDSKLKIPDTIVDKMIDSLSGIDIMGEIVPDFNLSPQYNTGILLRPRQTMILNKSEALRNVISFLNSVLSTDSIVLKIQSSPEFKKSRLNQIDQFPTDFDFKVDSKEELAYIGAKNNEVALVVSDSDFGGIWTLYKFNDGFFNLIKNQTSNTKKFWTTKEWYASGFSSNLTINFIVDQYNAIAQLGIKSGDVIKVLTKHGFEIYYFDTPNDSRLIGLEYGTIEFLENIWDQTQIGFDSTATDQEGFDGNNSIEIRQILYALRYEILTGSLENIFNQMIFVLINYILSEQNNVGWAFKTSFIRVIHNIRALEQTPNFIKDNQNYYVDYINEVKPYRTKIRDYVLSYSNLDVGKIKSTDFDLPSSWDGDLKMYRSPSGEYPVKDGQSLLQPQYQDWRNNLHYSIESIKIVNPGLGFLLPPSIKIVSLDGFGSGATAIATINPNNGSLASIRVTNPGSGYVSTPLIMVNGDGFMAELVPVMTNKKIRSFKIVLKFDRISYTTQVTEWLPNKFYKFGSLVSYQGQGYRANTNVPAFELFNYSLFSRISDSDYISANDRIASIYRPDYYQSSKEIGENGSINLSRLIPGIIRSANTNEGTPLDFGDDLSQPLALKNVDQNQYIISGGAFDKGEKVANSPEELVPGIIFESISIKVITKEVNLDDNLDFQSDRMLAYRIVKDTVGNVGYFAMSRSASAVLLRELNWNDTVIYVDDVSVLTLPNPANNIPGVIYISGEKIRYFAIDKVTNTIGQLIRGADKTSIPEVHQIYSIIEDASSRLEVPSSISEQTQSIAFSKNIRVVGLTFNVPNNLLQIREALTLKIGSNILPYGEYYLLSIDNSTGTPVVLVTFTKTASNRILDGLIINVTFSQERIWLNPSPPGSTRVTDGLGLMAASTIQANFLKTKLY